MTKDIESRLIQAKDQRNHQLHALTTQSPVCLTLKANQPGWPKNTITTAILLKLFNHLIRAIFSFTACQQIQSEAGDTIVYTITGKAKQLKKQTVYFENHHPLGRYIDLDVYDHGTPITREDLNMARRKCYLCHDPAHQCAVLKRHSINTLREHVSHHVIDYLKHYLAESVATALRKELALYPKLGLVSFRDSGIHDDMHYRHFLTSIRVLTPFFYDFIQQGENHSISLEPLRTIGKLAESAMFEATKNINTHKGAIFIFGAFLPYYTKAIFQQTTLKHCLSELKHDIQPMIASDFKNMNQQKPRSFGEYCYKEYQLGGIREEVSNGFPSLFSWYPKKYDNDYQKLLHIASTLDDTTIIKRTSIEVLRQFQNSAKDFLEQPFNFEAYKAYSNDCKARFISPGGSADLLALLHFIEATDYILKPLDLSSNSRP